MSPLIIDNQYAMFITYLYNVVHIRANHGVMISVLMLIAVDPRLNQIISLTCTLILQGNKLFELSVLRLQLYTSVIIYCHVTMNDPIENIHMK